MCGAVAVGRLEAAPTVITIGRSPVSTFDGSVMNTLSVPGRSVVVLILATITVVPIVTLIAVAAELRTPVKDIRSTVATWVPPLFVVTKKGSGVHEPAMVALHTTARPPGPLVVVKTSGCAATIVTTARNTVPLALMTSGYDPDTNPIGTTNLISVELTA